jgi:hypothetical protein
MEFENLIELNVCKQVDRIFGDKDSKLKLITKIDLLENGSEEMKESTEKMLQTIKRSNEMEAYYIKRQLFFTLDKNGNLVEVE